MINTGLNLVELIRIDDKTWAHIARKYAQVWLTRYPWPTCCIHDNGGELFGPEFQLLLEGCRIRDMQTHASNSRKRFKDTTAWTAATTDNRRTRKRFH
jgi:hypothetical protein